MRITNEEYVIRITNCISSKKEHLEEILRITKLQKKAIDEGNFEKLASFYEIKKQRIDSINLIDSEFEIYFNKLKSILGISSFEEATSYKISGLAELKTLVEEVYSIMSVIYKLEAQNNEIVQSKTEEVKENVSIINATKNVTKAYAVNKLQKSNLNYFDVKK